MSRPRPAPSAAARDRADAEAMTLSLLSPAAWHAVLLVATSVGCDMQQDRSTGWRLGSNRALQFRFQVLGLLVGITNGLGVAVAGIHPLIMTLATATFLQGLAYLVLPIPGGEVPASLRKLAPENVVVRPLGDNVTVVTTAIAWNTQRPNLLLDQLKTSFR